MCSRAACPKACAPSAHASTPARSIDLLKAYAVQRQRTTEARARGAQAHGVVDQGARACVSKHWSARARKTGCSSSSISSSIFRRRKPHAQRSRPSFGATLEMAREGMVELSQSEPLRADLRAQEGRGELDASLAGPPGREVVVSCVMEPEAEQEDEARHGPSQAQLCRARGRGRRIARRRCGREPRCDRGCRRRLAVAAQHCPTAIRRSRREKLRILEALLFAASEPAR